MTIIFLLITAIFYKEIAELARHFSDETRVRQKNAGRLKIIAIIIFFVFFTIFSLVSPKILSPLWFEDLLTIDLAVVFIALFFYFTRKMPAREVVFAAAAFFISVSLLLTVVEIALRIRPPRLMANRLGGRFTYRSGTDTYKILIKPVPAGNQLEALYNSKTTLDSYFDIKDKHVIPMPDKKEKRVLLLGDSMVEGSRVDAGSRFSNLLEKKMGIPHYNLAMAGTSLDYHLLMTERYLNLIKPDLVILGYFPFNDCIEFGGNHTECPQYYKPLYSLKNGVFHLNQFSEKELAFYSIASMPPALLLQFATHFTIIGNLLADLREKTIGFIGNHFIAIKFKKESGIIGKYYQKNDNDGVCQAIKTIDSLVRSHGAELIVLEMPYLSEKSTDEKQVEFIRNYGYETCRAEGRKCLSNMNVEFIDGKKPFEKEIAENKTDMVLVDDKIHLNETGHRKMADFLEPIERKHLYH